jgi:hypothetical protein
MPFLRDDGSKITDVFLNEKTAGYSLFVALREIKTPCMKIIPAFFYC